MSARGMRGPQRLVLALVCAVAVSTIYAIQPVLAAAGADLGVPEQSLGWLVATGQIGYFAGLVLLVPLGDLFDRRGLITGFLLATAAGSGLTAAAPNWVLAAAGLALAGLFAVVVQVAVAYVAAVSPDEERGRNIGTVTSGVVIGILGVRVLAGVLGDTLGWRAVYAALALLCLALAATVRLGLRADARPAAGRAEGRAEGRLEEHVARRYARVLASMGRLAATDRLFLGRGAVAFFLFASFGTLWSGLALPLGAEPWKLSTTQIGLFGLVGLAGALGAARAGRWADDGRAQPVSGWALALLAASWLLIARTEPTLWWLIAGIVLLDFAVQAVHVSSQHMLTAAHPHRASTVIGAYMAFYSLGSALGAVTTAWAYGTWGWPASCALGAGYALAGLGAWGMSRRSAAGRCPAVTPTGPR